MFISPLLSNANGSLGLPLLASLEMGLAVGLAVWWVFSKLQTEDLTQGDEWRHDVSRVNELRRTDVFYRVFQPLIQGLAWLNRSLFNESLPGIERDVHGAGLSRSWLPEEYLARLELIGISTFPVHVYVYISALGMAGGLMAAPVGVILTIWLLRRGLASRRVRRIHAIKRRMPYLLDLLTLMMNAGSTFLSALAQAVKEFPSHSVSIEFGRVLSDMGLGKTRSEALEAMRTRLGDDEISGIIGAILQGEKLGTPLANILRTQADVLRVKRTQRAETIAGEAGVQMLLPGVLVMMAAVIIILGPFLMNYMQFGLFL